MTAKLLWYSLAWDCCRVALMESDARKSEGHGSAQSLRRRRFPQPGVSFGSGSLCLAEPLSSSFPSLSRALLSKCPRRILLQPPPPRLRLPRTIHVLRTTELRRCHRLLKAKSPLRAARRPARHDSRPCVENESKVLFLYMYRCYRIALRNLRTENTIRTEWTFRPTLASTKNIIAAGNYCSGQIIDHDAD